MKSAGLLTYVRYVDFTDILFCEELKEKMTGAGICGCFNRYIMAESFQWENCVGFSADETSHFRSGCKKKRPCCSESRGLPLLLICTGVSV